MRIQGLFCDYYSYYSIGITVGKDIISVDMAVNP